LNAAYREIFLTAKLPRPPLPAKPPLPAVTPFEGYGPSNFVMNGRRVAGHLGAAPGVSTGVDWYSDASLTVVSLSNYDPSPDANVNQTLRGILTS
jgi:hypothetical protein